MSYQPAPNDTNDYEGPLPPPPAYSNATTTTTTTTTTPMNQYGTHTSTQPLYTPAQADAMYGSTHEILYVRQPPRWCQLWCMAISVFVFHQLTLVWPTYYTVTTVFFFVTLLLGVYGVSKRDARFVRPMLWFSWALVVMSSLLTIFTWIDHNQKCNHHKNLNQRKLQNSYSFDCEADVIGLVFWSIAMIVYVILCGVWVITVRGVYGEAGYMVDPPADDDTRAKYQDYTATALAAGVVAAAIITGMYVSFHNRSHVVEGVCPVGSNTGYFTKPRTNDLGCCDWLKSEGTCCQQQGCDLKPGFAFSNVRSDQETCDNLLGLLSCSFCRKDAGKFVISGFDQYRVCESFCQQLFNSCSSSSGSGGNATEWCESNFSGMYVQATNANDSCFNSAFRLNAMHPFIIIVLGVCVSLILQL